MGSLGAQARTPAPDSTSRRCLDVGWLDPSASCEGRLLNGAGLSLAGAAGGALVGGIGGAIAPTRCVGGSERAAVRGAIGGAVAGALVGAAWRHVSRRERAARDAEARAGAARDTIRPWSWRDIRPAAVAVGAVAALGAGIGATQGARGVAGCGGVAGGTLRGAGVYGGGAAAGLLGTLLVVRFAF